MQPKELFEVLVQEHAEMLTVFLQSAVRDPAAADDLFQETLLVAWRNLDRFDRDRSFGHWLRGIAKKLILAHGRRSRKAFVCCSEEVLDYVGGRCEDYQRHKCDTLEERLESLRHCVEALPDKYRQAVHMRYTEELRGRRLAESLQTSIENAKKLLQRGRQRLLDCLSRTVFSQERA